MSTFRETAKEVKTLLNELRADSRAKFVSGVYRMHKGIVDVFYSGEGGLNRRTGAAAKSWHVVVNRQEESISASINSSGVPYADFSNVRNITPKNGKWLAIPVGPALTSAGVARYPKGPWQAKNSLTVGHAKRKGHILNSDPLFFLKKGGDTAFLIAKKGVTGIGITKQNRILFILKKKVAIPAYTKGLMPYVDGATDRMMDTMLSFGSKQS
jgi:hypothetical protein